MIKKFIKLQVLVLWCGSALLAAVDCPKPAITPERSILKHSDPEDPFVDNDREIKDLGTDFVVRQFFRTPDTIYNFMKLVYQSLDGAVSDYRAKHKLPERALFVVFKGGNVLRMVANEVFDLLPAEARNLLADEYLQYFKRSDADFSVYLDERKLLGLDYERTLNEVTELLFKELGKIRAAFKENPYKYFNFSRYKPAFANKVLKSYFDGLNAFDSIKNKDNANWYGAKFVQMQLLGNRANENGTCPYSGVEDYRVEEKDGQVVLTRLSEKPDWIVNTDNRTLEWKLGSDTTKTVKFYLVRSKAYFNYLYEKDGKIMRKAAGGELIDVSIPNRLDSHLNEFLDSYDKNIARYTLMKNVDDKFEMNAYSLNYLAKDLQSILFDSFERPWDGGPKYSKRLNRLFFLFTVEMLGHFGLGAKEMETYINNVKEYLLPPLDKLFPICPGSKTLAQDIKRNAVELARVTPQNTWANDFWKNFAKFLDERIVKAPKAGDEEGLKAFIETIEHNFDVALKLTKMKPMKIDLKKVFEVELLNLF